MKMKITILEDSVIESERLKNGIRKYGQQWNYSIYIQVWMKAQQNQAENFQEP